jgi:pSer/pThr/pTyr-binding forkhead associated (FHA) protein
MKLVPKRTAEAAREAAKSGDSGVLARWKEGLGMADKANTPPNGSQPPAAGNQQPAAGNQQPGPEAQNPKPAQPPAAGNQQPAAGNQQPGPEAQNPKPAQPPAGPKNTTRIRIETSGNGFDRPVYDFELKPGECITIGRHPDNCQLVNSASMISGRHARLEIENGRVYVTDLSSTNGTFWYGKKLEPNQKTDITSNPKFCLGLTDGGDAKEVRVIRIDGDEI